MKLSVIVPVYNEESKNLAQLVSRLKEVLSQNCPGLDFEIIFIDDGSQNPTRAYLKELQAQHLEVRLVFLSRNFGEQAAIAAGLAHARGEAVINMDSDLQDPPEMLPQMLAFWKEGYDVVYTRQVSRHEPISKTLPAYLFYRLLNSMSDIHIPHDAGEFRLMSRRVVDTLNKMPEKTRFLRGLVPWVGFSTKELPFTREDRQSGQSSYTLKKLVRLAVDALISFSNAPLFLVSTLGALVLLAVLANVVYLVLNPQSVATTTTSNFLLIELEAIAGIQILAVGIIAAYVAQLINEVRGRPTYIVAETFGFQKSGNSFEADTASSKLTAGATEQNLFLKAN